MNEWVKKYSQLISPGIKRHSIVADRNRLFKYDEVFGFLENAGHVIFEAGSTLDARLIFELNIRRSEKSCILFVPYGYEPMPDMLLTARFKQLGLSQVFPKFHSETIEGLSANALGILSEVTIYEELNQSKTLKFIIENLFNLDFETLENTRSRERLIHALITVYLEREEINPALQSFFEGLFSKLFPEIADKLSPDVISTLLVEQWALFVRGQTCSINFGDPILPGSMVFLFAAQFLTPQKVSTERFKQIPITLRMGVYIDELEKTDHELESLCSYLENLSFDTETSPSKWFKIIKHLSLARIKLFGTNSNILQNRYLSIENSLNIQFQEFVENVYPSIFSLSGIRNPTVVSRILEHIAASKARKKALLVIDGLNSWQWQLLADTISINENDIQYGATLAFIPTITAWSRQAIFRGSLPNLEEDNSKEQKYFEEFWASRKYNNHQIAFKKISTKLPLDWDEISDDVLILGLVCNDLDDLMHGAVFSEEHHRISTIQWAKEIELQKLMHTFITRGFRLFITSDHGSVNANGVKSLTLADKIGAISRSKRHLKFKNETLKNHFLALNSGLPLGRSTLSVWCKHSEAFVPENQKVITHGGSHIWEVIVPFITINGRE